MNIFKTYLQCDNKYCITYHIEEAKCYYWEDSFLEYIIGKKYYRKILFKYNGYIYLDDKHNYNYNYNHVVFDNLINCSAACDHLNSLLVMRKLEGV